MDHTKKYQKEERQKFREIMERNKQEINGKRGRGKQWRP
jgi:hypothetical protein